MKIIRTVLIGCAALVGAAVVLKPYPITFGSGNIFIRYPGMDDQVAEPLASVRAPFRLEHMKVIASDGVSLSALHLRREQPQGLLVYFQGGGSFALGVVDELDVAFRDSGFDVLIFDYRGTGLTGGKSDTGSVLPDISLLVAQSRQFLPAAAPVVAYGVSMGTLFARDFAQQGKVDGLILDSAITTVTELVTGQVPGYVLPFSTLHIDDDLEKLSKLDKWGPSQVPTLLLTGALDQLTPSGFSHRIAQRIGDPGCVMVTSLAGAGHAQALSTAAGRAAVAGFLTRVQVSDRKSCQPAHRAATRHERAQPPIPALRRAA